MNTDKRQLWCMVGRGRGVGGLVEPFLGLDSHRFLKFLVSVFSPISVHQCASAEGPEPAERVVKHGFSFQHSKLMKLQNELLRALRLRESSPTHVKQQNSALAWQWPMRIRVTGYLRLSHATQRGFRAAACFSLAFGLASLFTPAKSDAAVLIPNDPIVDSNDNIALNVSATNNDTGAIYNSAELNVFKELASQLYALPANQANYGSVTDLMADWNFFIDPTGDVSNGWNSQKENDGSISLTNRGFNYHEWTSNPGSNTQLYTLTIPMSQLDFTGVSGYNPDKAGIVLSGLDNTMSDAFVGTMDMDNIFSADSQFYQVAIPEEKTYAIIFGLAALGAGLYRRHQKKSESNGLEKMIE